MSAAPLVCRSVMAVLVIAAAIYDCKYRKIPNWLNLSGLILGFGINIFFSGRGGFVSSLEGMLVAFAVYLPLYLIKGMGAGDVKLMSTLGAVVGPFGWFQIFLATSLLGGLTAALFALGKKRFGETCVNVFGILQDLLHLRAPYRTNRRLDIRDPRALRMPHGITIALGSLAALAFQRFLP